MDVQSYLADLAARGHQVTLRGADVVVGNAGALTDDDRAYIRLHKTEIRAARDAGRKVEAPVPTAIQSSVSSSRAPRPVRPAATTIKVIPSQRGRPERGRVSSPERRPKRDAANGRFTSTSAQPPPQLSTSAPEPDATAPGHSWLGHFLYGNFLDFSQPADGCHHPDCVHARDRAGQQR